MNEFSAKKLGEVLAFAEVSLDTIEKSRVALSEVFDSVESVERANKEHREAILELVANSDMAEITTNKASATGEKLKKMRDMYIGDEWDNPAELMEWSGFFEGAALVHWALVRGVGDKLGHKELVNIAEIAESFHRDLLDKVELKIKETGFDKA